MANKDVQIRKDNKASTMFDVAPDFEAMVERFFGPHFTSVLGDWTTPQQRSIANVQENDKGYLIMAEIPGIPKEEVEINLDGNMLTIRANHNNETKAPDQRTYRRQYKSFQQSFSLPSNVDTEHIEAHYENGVLEVLVPKMAQAQSKRIEIQTGQATPLNSQQQAQSGAESQSKH